MEQEKNQHFLDITNETCPMTFVKVRLLLEALSPGAEAHVRLCGEEPLRNVPEALRENGYDIISLCEDPNTPGIYDLLVRCG